MAFNGYGLELEAIQLPEPNLVAGCALLQILTCGVCFSDVKTWTGSMPFSEGLPLPHVPGHEICARVLAADPPGALEPGTLVVVYHLWPCRLCDRCRAGEENLCRAPRRWVGFTHHGGLQERIVVPLDRLVTVPAGVGPVEAAPMTCALGTAYRAVVTRGAVQAGARVAIIGLGGVGMHALQIARAVGGQAVGLDLSDRAIDTAERLGLNAARADDLDVETALARCFEGGFDVVVDAVGGEQSMCQANRLVRPGGRIVVVGYSVNSSFSVSPPRFVLEEVELMGSRYVRMDELERAIRLVADGLVVMVIDSVKPLELANDAFRALQAGQVVGRIVVDVANTSML